MATAGRWRGVTAFAVGAVVAWLAAEGHRVASGTAPSTGSMTLAAGVVATSALVGTRLPWTWWRVVAAIAVLQPVMHFVFSAFPADAAAHVHGHHDMSGSASGWTMVAAHITATVVAAVLLRVGGRWLVRMPQCVRAISLFVRRRGPPRRSSRSSPSHLRSGTAAARRADGISLLSPHPPRVRRTVLLTSE